MRHGLKQWIVISLLVISPAISSAAEQSNQDAAKFLSVADIHFDPFAGCVKSSKPCLSISKLRTAAPEKWAAIFEQYGEKTISNVYHDANYPLLKTSLIEIKKVNESEHPRFAMIMGDFIAHEFRRKYIKYSGDKTRDGYQAFVKKTFQFLAYEFVQTLPNLDIYPVIGNNDSYTGDYEVAPHGKFLQDMADIWSVGIKDKTNLDNFKRNLPILGYYKIVLPTNLKQSIIVLNSVLFSSHIHSKTIQAAANQEFHWLHEQLQYAKDHHQQVIIADHIPIGIDAYATIKNQFNHVQQFWQPVYNTQFEDELNQFPSVIIAILSAHIHSDTFQFITVNKVSEIPVYFTPSISPIYGNNPGFKVFNYDVKTLQLGNFDSYYFPLDQGGGLQWDKN